MIFFCEFLKFIQYKCHEFLCNSQLMLYTGVVSFIIVKIGPSKLYVSFVSTKYYSQCKVPVVIFKCMTRLRLGNTTGNT